MRTIVFQVPAGVTSFDFADSASLEQTNAMVKTYCGECFGGDRFLTRGTLAGQKINDNTWVVEGSLSSPLSPFLIYTFKALFKAK